MNTLTHTCRECGEEVKRTQTVIQSMGEVESSEWCPTCKKQTVQDLEIELGSRDEIRVDPRQPRTC